jgi:eukaryotic-like serine/threonine-protein kinase
MSRALPDSIVAHLRDIADEPDLSGTKYRLGGRLGRGGMAAVWAAHDTVLDRSVAIKVLDVDDPDGALASRMLREARILARLEHPGIVPVHDAGRLPDGRVFYVMKHVRGSRLDALLPDLPDRDARLRIFERLCEAVAFAHAHDVVHRDLKPANVMIGEFGEVLVMDWGVAGLLDGRTGEAPAAPSADREAAASAAEGLPEPDAVTARGIRVGTPGFMSPEQVRGDSAAADARADVWGLGAVLHVLVCDRLPDGLPAGRGVPRALAAVLGRALAPVPAERYDSAGDLAADVRRFLAGVPPTAYREPLHERAGRLVKTYRVPIALVLSYILMRALLLLFA